MFSLRGFRHFANSSAVNFPLLSLFLLSFGAIAPAFGQVVTWPVAGQGAANLRSQPEETFVGASNAASLVAKWVFTTSSDVSATPTVGTTAVYFPDWSGNLYAVNLATGAQLWSHQISEYDNETGSYSRVSPAIYNTSLIIGDAVGTSHSGANVISVDQTTGGLNWITNIESHPAAIITGSPVVVGTTIYQGVSSIEEGLATSATYACCTFRGSIVALDADTGQILWKTYTIPNNFGETGRYSGGPIWQPPAIDTTRNQLYVGTGNNYSVPVSVENCRKKNPKGPKCDSPEDYFDSALALDLTTGVIKWAEHLYGYDAWNLACLQAGPPPNCPNPEGPDYDLGGSGPNIVGNIVGFGQKNGMYWALDPDTGTTVWSLASGPAGPFGGIQWGTASDGTNIYIANSNSNYQSYKLLSGQTVTWGFWSAVNASTGQVLWQTADPTSGTRDVGALSVANGIVYTESLDSAGHMYALNSANGDILWSYASGGSLIDGPSIVSGNLFWGSGYRRTSGATGNNKVYDFTPAPAVTVTAPVNGSTVSSPVLFTATAASPNCSKGISSMRIYSDGVNEYTVYSGTLNHSISLSPGTYNEVVQSWDNCGNVGKTFVTVTVSSGSK
jgi:polyvinyl alcohol dehydrogenase (cytochrome)